MKSHSNVERKCLTHIHDLQHFRSLEWLNMCNHQQQHAVPVACESPLLEQYMTFMFVTDIPIQLCLLTVWFLAQLSALPK